MSEAAAGGRRAIGERALVPAAEPRSYYGRPILKAPVWTPEVPWYFFTGGLAGASAAQAYAASLSGRPLLARHSSLVALLAATASPVLLVRDLGRPARFLNMLRVFKITSPLSVGAWLLSASGIAIGLAAANETLGMFPRAGRFAKPTAALLGLPLSTYTAALVANTAVPAWHEARRELPFVFAASAAASAGAVAAAVTPPREAGPARRLALIGAATELLAVQAMERRLGWLGEPYRRGEAARYARSARLLTFAGGALLALAGRRRAGTAGRPRAGAAGRGSRAAVVAGASALLAGSVLERWAVFKAGFQSARDPKYVVAPQRARLGQR